MKNVIVIVGAGPAGLMSAIAAAQNYPAAEVVVCEQLSRPGAKLLATGGGKCNLTNILPPDELAKAFGRQWRFMLPALQLMPPQQLREWLMLRGIATVVSDGFHVFPESESARDVLEALLAECHRLKVNIRCQTVVSKILIEHNQICGVIANNEKLSASRVIIATGGRSYPSLGATGSGYLLATQAGHQIIKTFPALSGLQTQEKWPCSCAGIAVENAAITIDIPKYRREIWRGELLFTHHGISGPPIINASRQVSALLEKYPLIPLKINLIADYDLERWLKIFDKWQRDHGVRMVKNLLAEMFPARLAEQLSFISGNENYIAARFPAAARRKLAMHLTALPLNIKSAEPWDKAMITRGGVALKSVDAVTLESRIVPGLHFAGEVLDLDGPCGGYNLQWAFSSGYLAGNLSNNLPA
ncbi:MAG: NAD(P)/FAD-dependent oxidoreductase [Victivallaceae bacterium]|nr:NAD(P)/FAD-dependent oxidoreductase [Victivallaceae bacterium]